MTSSVSQDLRGAGQLECALLRGALSGALRRFRKADDLEAGGRSVAIHFARRHGVADQTWSARSHGRGVAAGLASRADRGARFQRRRARGRSGPRGARGSAGARPARLPGHARRSGHRARRAPASRVAAARTCHLDSGAGLATGTARQASQRRGLLRQPALAGACAGVRLSPRGRRNRRALDDRALRRAFGPGARDVRRSSPDAGRHHGGRRGRLAGGAVRLRPVLHGRLPVRVAGGEGTPRDRARGPASSRSR